MVILAVSEKAERRMIDAPKYFHNHDFLAWMEIMTQPNGKKITLRCMVENSAQFGSELWGEHGAAFWIETSQGSLLFDSGQSGDVLLHNAEKMEVDLGRCDALALSHAHYDHTGGLIQTLILAPGARVHGHPDIFLKLFWCIAL